MATKLRNFSRHWAIKTISFLLCAACLSGGMLGLLLADMGFVSTEYLSDYWNGRSFWSSEYLARESALRFDAALQASGWYAESLEDAAWRYENKIDRLQGYDGLFYHIKAPYGNLSNTDKDISFFESHKVWYIFTDGSSAKSYDDSDRGIYYISGPMISYNPADNNGEDAAPFPSVGVDEGFSWEKYYQEQMRRYSAYFCMTDEAVAQLEAGYTRNVVRTGYYFWAMLGCAALGLFCLLHLLAVCGRRPGREELVLLPLLDRPFLDITLVLFFFAGWAFLENTAGRLNAPTRLGWTMIGLALATVSFLGLYWILAAVKQLKNRSFCRRTLIGAILIGIGRGVKRILSHWRVTVQMGFLAGLICFCGMSIPLFCAAVTNSAEVGVIVGLMMLASVSYLAARWAVQLGKIAVALRKLRAGDYSAKLPEEGFFFQRTMSSDINHIGDGLEKAVETAMRSERFKAELISNVSHDLRTPLTSVITYADLLQTEGLDTPDAPRYLEIITQKAARLKALTEDLFEASKAASGEMKAELVPLELSQLLSQALGEMDERLSAAALDVRLSGTAPFVMADGKMLWRVLENLLGNIIKYSLPGSRVYIDTATGDGRATLTLRNISRDPLPEESGFLTERFARGDEARSTEGSGLGLSIVKSFMELQGGAFTLSTDGDLFKATLTLPLAEGR